MSDKSSRSRRSRKVLDPAKWPAGRPKPPYPDFPLTPHMSGKWMKKIRGTIHYFGNWARVVDGVLTRVDGDGWKEALELYKAQADDLHAGRTPRVKGDELTVGDLCNQFLTAMLRRLETGQRMSPRMFAEYRATTDRIVATFGKKRLVDDLAPNDFAALGANLAKRYGPVRRGNEVQKVRTIFKWGIENDQIKQAVRYGTEFKKPDKGELRKHRQASGDRTFEATEIREMLDAAGPQLRAMIFLGVNVAFGNSDVANLPQSALDLEGGWHRFGRPKTGIERKAKLWPETVAALREVIAKRGEPKDPADAGLVFLTIRGHRCVRTFEQERTDQGPKPTTVDAVGVEFGKLLRKLGIDGHRGFYSLRHSFRTVADATKDPNAIRLIMGHTDDSIDANYTHGIDEARLITVAQHVRAWLWPKPTEEKPADKSAKPKRQHKPKAKPAESSAARPTLRLFAG